MRDAGTRMLLACWAVGALVAPAMAAITTESLLSEMTDLKRLATLPEPAYMTKQFSSYDRASKTHSDSRAGSPTATAGSTCASRRRAAARNTS